MARFVGVALVFALLLMVSGGLVLEPIGTGALLGDTWECDEYETDYSERCQPNADACGSFCVYAECIECTPATHEHCDEEVCDEDCEGEGDDEVCVDTNCTQYCWLDPHGESPCVSWNWHIKDDADDHRTEGALLSTFSSPNVDSALSMGSWDPGYIHPPARCDDGEVVSGTSITVLDAADPGVFSAGFLDSGLQEVVGGEIVVRGVGGEADTVLVPRGPGGLVEIPGGLGAPVLSEVSKVDDTHVSLVVTGDAGLDLESRYWVYGGDPPHQVRVPYEGFTSTVNITETTGIHSFQVRTVDGMGVVSLGSNVVHQIVGMEVMRSAMGANIAALSGPEPPAVLPTPAVGNRPGRPTISAVEQLPGSGVVKVTLAGAYGGDVEYRWWPHSGADPSHGVREWTFAGSGISDFVVSGVSIDLAVSGLGVDPLDGVDASLAGPLGSLFSSVQSGGQPMLNYFDFQVRVVDADGLESPASDVKVLKVWRGNLWEW